MLTRTLAATLLFTLQSPAVEQEIQHPLPHPELYTWSATVAGFQVAATYTPALQTSYAHPQPPSPDARPQAATVPFGNPIEITVAIRNATTIPLRIQWTAFDSDCTVTPLAGQHVMPGMRMLSAPLMLHHARLLPGESRYQQWLVGPGTGDPHVTIGNDLLMEDPPPGPYTVNCHWQPSICIADAPNGTCTKYSGLKPIAAPPLALTILQRHSALP
jgi:hypothetical protein